MLPGRYLAPFALALLCSAWPASAQNVSLEFKDGRVRLSATNVPVSRILAEWARVGGTKIVNGERVPGVPVTLQLEGVTEQQAIDTLLRGAAGYMVGARPPGSAGASVFDRILVLPTTTRVAATAAVQPPPPPPPQRFVDSVDELDEEPERLPLPRGTPPPANRFPAGRVPNTQPEPFEVDDEDQVPPRPSTPPPATPGNPFGVIPGGALPGSVTPVVPRNPNVPTNVPQER